MVALAQGGKRTVKDSTKVHALMVIPASLNTAAIFVVNMAMEHISAEKTKTEIITRIIITTTATPATGVKQAPRKLNVNKCRTKEIKGNV